MDIFEQVRQVTVETLKCDLASVTPTARLSADLGADSLDAMELCMALEEAFGLTISDEELAQIVTIGDIVRYISHQRTEQ